MKHLRATAGDHGSHLLPGPSGPALAADFVVGAIHSRAASQSRGITQEERIGHYSIHVADIPEY